jgi:hypothetical protein
LSLILSQEHFLKVEAGQTCNVVIPATPFSSNLVEADIPIPNISENRTRSMPWLSSHLARHDDFGLLSGRVMKSAESRVLLLVLGSSIDVSFCGRDIEGDGGELIIIDSGVMTIF